MEEEQEAGGGKGQCGSSGNQFTLQRAFALTAICTGKGHQGDTPRTD